MIDQTNRLMLNRSNLIIIIAAALIWFAMLGYRDLLDPDEGRYAEVSREMQVSGDWITPRENGIKFFDKPPLQYWGTAISIALLGPTNAAARLYCSSVAFFGALWVWFVAARLFGERAGRNAFLVLISSSLYLFQGHLNTLDVGVSVFLMVAIGAMLLAQSVRDKPRACRNWMLVGWAGLAAATLSKGLIGIVLPGAALVIYSVWQRDWALWKNLHLGKGLLLFLLLTAPWFILVTLKNPEFPHYFFIHEHFERFTSGVHKRGQPWWFFFATLTVGSIPWVYSFYNTILRPPFTWRAEAGRFDPARLLWIYALFIFFFFSISSSKLMSYIVPMLLPLALLIGAKTATGYRFTIDLVVTAVVALIMIIGGSQLGHFASPSRPLELLLDYRPWVIAAGFLWAISAAIGWFWRRHSTLSIAAFSLTALLAVQMLSWGVQAMAPLYSARIIADKIRPYSEAGIPVYNFYSFEESLPYYLQRFTNVVGHRGELDFGLTQEPERWIADVDQFRPIWLKADQAVAVMQPITYGYMEDLKLPVHLIYQGPRHVVVLRQPPGTVDDLVKTSSATVATEPAPTELRIGTLAFGTVNWELETIKRENLSKAANFKITTVKLASPHAIKVALQADAVDLIVADWIWVSRRRASGEQLTFAPYSTTSGALVVPADSMIQSIDGLAGKRLGIAGGPLDKNWLLLRAVAEKNHQLDLNQSVEKVFAAPPLLNQQIQQNRLDAIINYWHYAARLEAKGYRRLLDGRSLLDQLGIDQKVPTLGYVFDDQWADNNRAVIEAFLAASRTAKERLCNAQQAWDAILPLTRSDDPAVRKMLRQGYCEGRIRQWGEAEKRAAMNIYQIMRQVGGDALTGAATELAPGTFWNYSIQPD